MSDKRCSVGGVDRTKEIDRISLTNAVETPFWMAVWAAEPERMVDVRMSYSDLKIICDLIDKERSRRVVNGMKRTYENCSLQKKFGEAGRDGDGTCMGFSRSEIDDEPCEICKKCKLFTGNNEEERWDWRQNFRARFEKTV